MSNEMITLNRDYHGVKHRSGKTYEYEGNLTLEGTIEIKDVIFIKGDLIIKGDLWAENISCSGRTIIDNTPKSHNIDGFYNIDMWEEKDKKKYYRLSVRGNLTVYGNIVNEVSLNISISEKKE